MSKLWTQNRNWEFLIAIAFVATMAFQARGAEIKMSSTAVVEMATRPDGSKAWAIKIKTETKYPSGAVDEEYSSPTVKQYQQLLKHRPDLADEMREAFEEDKDPAESLSGIPVGEHITIYYEDKTPLNKIAKGFNATEILVPTPNRPMVQQPSVKPTAKNSKVDKAIEQLRVKDADHIDKKKLEKLLDRKDTDLKGQAAKATDIKALYDALAVLLSDSRCHFSRAKSKQTYQTRGLAVSEPDPIEIDSKSTDIGGGHLTLFSTDANVPSVNLGWDAEYMTEMSVGDWLYGNPNAATNGHVGFYRQLANQELCGFTKGDYPHRGGRNKTTDHDE